MALGTFVCSIIFSNTIHCISHCYVEKQSEMSNFDRLCWFLLINSKVYPFELILKSKLKEERKNPLFLFTKLTKHSLFQVKSAHYFLKKWTLKNLGTLEIWQYINVSLQFLWLIDAGNSLIVKKICWPLGEKATHWTVRC